jgi:hypothetical protein
MLMMKKLSALCCLLVSLLAPLSSSAQDYNIKDDTIKVSSSAYPMLSFMGEIRDYNALCSDYKISSSTTTLTIRPSTSKPVKVCRLIVSEGSKNSPRQHQFVLVFDKEADPAEQIHDYSTKDLMEQRIAYLEKARSGGATASADGDDDKPKSKKKKKKEKEQEEEEPVVKADKPADVEEELPAKPEKPTVIKNTSGKNTAKNTPVKTTYTEPSGDDAETSSDGIQIKDIPEEQLKARVRQKINAFYRACENLCAKIDVNGTVTYGMKLFNNNEDVIVATVNSKTNATRPQKIRQYFVHLSQLSYKRVEMTASEIKFVSNFHKGPDGKWHASAVIIQDFKGYKDYNILAYKDQTSKTVDIIITMTEEIKDGKTVQKFDIFLGNISVTNVPS